MNYQPVVAGNQPNHNADPHNTDDTVVYAAFDVKENENDVHVSAIGSDRIDSKKHDEKAKRDDKEESLVDSPIGVRDLRAEFEEFSFNSTNSPYVNVVSLNFRIARKYSFVDPSKHPDDPNMPEWEDIVYSDDEEDIGAEADLSNSETNIPVSPILTTRVYKDHPVNQITGDLNLAPQTRSITRMVKEQGGLHQINDEDFHTCMFACFLSQKEPKWMLKVLFFMEPFKEEVYIYQPPGFEDPDYHDKVYKVVKALYGLHQDPRACDYARASLDRKSITGGCQFLGKKTSMSKRYLIKFFKESGEMLPGLQVKKKDDGIFIRQDKYVAEILRRFGFTNVKSASTPIETEKPLLMETDGKDMDVHIYRLMIGSLMYLTSSRPDYMFAICACARFQPKVSHLHAVKRIFRHLKGKPHLGLWYPKDSPFNPVVYSDSDYTRANLDRKSITGGCQFLGCRLIYWQCKKQTVVAISSTDITTCNFF
nr:hypothetical protein [Tanacetum cinerariifolium]